jgi:hypothetical protein
MIRDEGNPICSEKACPSVRWSTVKLTLAGPGSNPSLYGERPATDHNSHVTARLGFIGPIHTYHAVPLPCHEYAFLKANSQGHGRFVQGRGGRVTA